MADFLGAISHPHRIRIIEELHTQELDVNTLKGILKISHSSVSQNLSVLRAHKVVAQRREGNRVFYRLTQPELANWLLRGVNYIEGGLQSEQKIRCAVDEVMKVWCHTPLVEEQLNVKSKHET